MIEMYFDEIKIDSAAVKPIKNVQAYVFSYLYHNYVYIDSVLIADRKAYEKAGSSYSGIYYQNLWINSKSFTVPLLRNASKTFAELMYSAWIQAGKPTFYP
jgi:hypothetical protein